MANLIVYQVAQEFTKLRWKAQIYNLSLGKIALRSDRKVRYQLQSEKDDIVHLTNMIYVKDLAMRTSLRQTNQKAWPAKTSNASRGKLRFDQKSK